MMHGERVRKNDTSMYCDSERVLRCKYCFEQDIQVDEEERHLKTPRHRRLVEQFVSQGNEVYGPIEAKDAKWFCKVCHGCTMESWDRVKAHLGGSKHRINLQRHLTKWYSRSDEQWHLDPPNGLVLHCVGDSHGGKYLFQSMSPKVKNHFITGSMFSFANGRRLVDLQKLGVKKDHAVLFSYGEIDVRCHIGRIASSEKILDYDKIINPLVCAYIERILGFIQGFGGALMVIILAVPPPSDRKPNPQAPFFGDLVGRVKITQRLNQALEKACGVHGLCFFQPFDGFTLADGTLNHIFSDGHVHIRSECCGPIHQKLVDILKTETSELESRKLWFKL